MKNQKQKAFTLAEILLVGGIVALIGSIILIFSKGAIEKAKIAKLLQFSAQIHHALGAYLIAEYKFEESGNGTCPTGKNFCDTSGNGNHGSNLMDNNRVSRAPNTEIPQLGKTGYFNGSVGNAFVASSVKYSESWLTIQAWIKPEEPDNWSDKRVIVWKMSDWDFYIKGGKLCFSSPTEFCSNTAVLEIGKWYHIVVTYGKSAKKLFVNTQEVASGTTEEEPLPNIGTSIYIGGYYVANFAGYIDEIRIYSEALTSTQIKKLYVQGAKKHGL